MATVAAILGVVTFAAATDYSYPQAPQCAELHPTQVAGEARVEWRPVYADVNGNAYPVETVTYAVYTLEGWSRTLIAKDLTECVYTFQAVEPGEQRFVQCLVFAYYKGEESDGAITELVPLGTPYHTLLETFADSHTQYQWSVEAYGYVDVRIENESKCGVESPDGPQDGYLVIKGDYTSGYGRLLSGLVSTADVKRPMLSFSTYNFGNDYGNAVNVYLLEPGTDDMELIYSTFVSEVAEEGCWGEINIPLHRAGDRTFQFVVEGVLDGFDTILIDNVEVASRFGRDLAITAISAPESAVCGTAVQVEVSLQNLGMDPAADFFVELYANGNLVETRGVSQEVEPKGECSVQFVYEIGPQQTEPVTFRAELIWFDDENRDNDRSETVTVVTRQPEVPTPSGLVADVVIGAVLLGWEAPVIEGANAAAGLNISGYNVYRDEARINDSLLMDCSYIDETVQGDTGYTYFITAVYDDGRESAPSNVVTVRSSAIERVQDSAVKIRLIDNSICISAYEDASYSVYSTAGAMLCSGRIGARVAEEVRIAVAPGLYVVKIGSEAKVVKVQ